MISIMSQVKEDMKKAKMQVANFISHCLSSRQVNKPMQRDNKGKSIHEEEKNNVKEQQHKSKKASFKGSCKFYKKYGSTLTLVCFESNNVEVLGG